MTNQTFLFLLKSCIKTNCDIFNIQTKHIPSKNILEVSAYLIARNKILMAQNENLLSAFDDSIYIVELTIT